MPKFVAVRAFFHNNVVHHGGQVVDLTEYEAGQLGSAVQRVAARAAAAVKQESRKAEAAKAEEQKAEGAKQKAAQKEAPAKGSLVQKLKGKAKS